MIERLYQEASCGASPQAQEGAAGRAAATVAAGGANQVWSVDFVFDCSAEGRVLECLTIVDDATDEVAAMVVERAISGTGVSGVLDRLAHGRGLPRIIRSDNSKEFWEGHGEVGT